MMTNLCLQTNTLETAGTYGATPLRSEAIPARANWVFALTKKRKKSASGIGRTSYRSTGEQPISRMVAD